MLGAYTFGTGGLLSPRQAAGRPHPGRAGLWRENSSAISKEFDSGVAVAWHRVPWTLGCAGALDRRAARQALQQYVRMDGRIVLAGEHASRLPAWQEGAVTVRAGCHRPAAQARDGGVMAKTMESTSHVTYSSRLMRPDCFLRLRLCDEQLVADTAAPPATFEQTKAPCSRSKAAPRSIKGVCQGCHMPDAKGAVGAGNIRRWPTIRIWRRRAIRWRSCCMARRRCPGSPIFQRCADRQCGELCPQQFRQSLCRQGDAGRCEGAALNFSHGSPAPAGRCAGTTPVPRSRHATTFFFP